MIVLGRITAPHGVKGWVRIHPFGDDPLAWQRMPEWWIGDEGRWHAYRLKGCRMQGGHLAACFDGVVDRGGADALCGQYVGAPREALPANAPGEYYWAELIGLEVENRAGQKLGRVDGLIETGANAVLRVCEGDTERLLPFVDVVVCEVDRVAGRIRVDWQADW